MDTERNKSVAVVRQRIEYFNEDALEEGGQIDYCHVTRAGAIYNMFLQGMLYAFAFGRSLTYPYFGVYLNLDGHRYNAISSALLLAWSFKIIWALLSDGVSICGKRRKSYMIIGWIFSFIGFFYGGVFLSDPVPYYAAENCTVNYTAPPTNVNAADEGMHFVYCLVFAVFFGGISAIAADGLCVEYSRREPKSIRGQIFGRTMVVSNLGMALGALLGGVFLNGVEYGGIFCFRFPYSYIFLIYAFISALGIVFTAFFTVENSKHEKNTSIPASLKQFWILAKNNAFLRVGFFFLIDATLNESRSSATLKIKQNWAKVTPIVNGINSILMLVVSSFAISIYNRWCKNLNWRYMLTICRCLIFSFGLAVDFITVFDFFRNQYFYFVDDLLSSIPFGIYYIIVLQLATEVSTSGIEGMVFGVMMTLWTVGGSLGIIIGNIVSSFFEVSDDVRYMRDTFNDRLYVFYSSLAIGAVNLCSLICVYTLLPKQKYHVQYFKKFGKPSRFCRALFLSLFFGALLFSFGMNIVINIPGLNCLHIVGGHGCE